MNHTITSDSQPPARLGLLGIYDGIVAGIARAGDVWLTGTVLRLTFASTLLLYYLHSSWGSVDGSLLNLFSPNDGAFAAMIPPVMEEAGYDKAEVSWPWHVFVTLGVMGELLLPVMIVVGLFTRIAAAGMIVVVLVQSYVDIQFHGLEEKSIGAMFDRLPDALIMDQRLLWITVLVLLVINGPGALSLDRLLHRRAG
ncbi:DoxX family protein [Rhizobiaceae bacterium]|nr:DoxX family protein [Rhizobiaceae bacterium]